jgi:hypothetical protein
MALATLLAFSRLKRILSTKLKVVSRTMTQISRARGLLLCLNHNINLFLESNERLASDTTSAPEELGFR